MSNNDQLEEIEVLSSIYPSEFELLPPIANTSLTNFKIHLVPTTTDGKHHGLFCTNASKRIYHVLRDVCTDIQHISIYVYIYGDFARRCMRNVL